MRSRGVANLPREIVFDILLKLPVESLVECKMVCKDWYHLIHNPQFIDLHLSQSISQQHHRYALISQPCIQKLSIYSLVEQEEDHSWRAFEEILIPETQVGLRFFISGSCNGLMCIAPDHNFKGRAFIDPVLICNLLTRECLKLPASTDPLIVTHSFTKEQVVVPKTHPELDLCLQDIGFGYDTMSNNYKLVRAYFLYLNYDHLCCTGEIMTMGRDRSWRRLEFPHAISSTKLETLFMNGSFYWIIDPYYTTDRPCLENILAFEIHDEKFSTIKLPPSVEVETEDSDISYVLMNLRDSLALVEYYDNTTTRIWQMMNDDSNWICQYTITTVACNPRLIPFSIPMNRNDTILWTVSSMEGCLVLYDTTKRQVLKVEVSESPSRFQTTSFVPSLISPKSVLKGSAQSCLRVCI